MILVVVIHMTKQAVFWCILIMYQSSYSLLASPARFLPSGHVLSWLNSIATSDVKLDPREEVSWPPLRRLGQGGGSGGW